MEFKNTPNKSYSVDGKIIWDSRSAAINIVIALWTCEDGPFILVSKRGPKAMDNIGKMNLVAGYLDWDEDGMEACFRETWEECGLDLPKLIEKSHVVSSYLDQPWYTNTKPSENRQNISLRYGITLINTELNDLPKLTTEFNEIEGEVEDPIWMHFNSIDNYEWAFNHDQVIKDFINNYANVQYLYR